MKTINAEEVCVVPEELIEEGQQRKLAKVSKFNDIEPYDESDKSDDADFEFAQDTIRDDSQIK